MRVHHLDCCSMCPWPERLVNGRGAWTGAGRMPAHCLLIETPASGLVLVDTGIGTEDRRDLRGRLGAGFVTFARPRADEAGTALAQVRARGFDPRDVRHILVTHLDVDHAGGLPDFPWAKVHVHAREHDAARAPATRMERDRYRPEHLAHGPDLARYDATGEPWKGLPAVRALPGLPPEILAIPMPGHTRGHACVAVDVGGRWLVHAGDAYFHRAAIEGRTPPAGLRLFERLVAVDTPAVRENHRVLGELARAHRADVTVFSAHDLDEFEGLVRGAAA